MAVKRTGTAERNYTTLQRRMFAPPRATKPAPVPNPSTKALGCSLGRPACIFAGDSGSSAGGYTLTTTSVPPDPPPYDFTHLLTLRERADLVLRNPVRGDEQFVTAARILCQFFTDLSSDNLFWDQVQQLVPDRPEIRRLLNSLGDFEDDEYRVLTQAGLDELTAAQLAGDLKIALDGYRDAADLPSVQVIRSNLRQLRTAICNAEVDLAQPQQPSRRRFSLKVLGRALSVAGVLVGVAVNIASHGVASVVAGLMAVPSATADVIAATQPERG
jgi:hypothetical protein